jgi:hypothetical protein
VNLAKGYGIQLMNHHVECVDSPKGLKRTDETKRKMSEAKLLRNQQMGYAHSEETRKKISETLKGKGNGLPPGSKRSPMSEETKKKIADAKTGVKRSEETRKKISDAQKGRVFTPEHRQKIKESCRNARQSSSSTRSKNVNNHSHNGQNK